MADWGKIGAIAAVIALPLAAISIWVAHSDADHSGTDANHSETGRPSSSPLTSTESVPAQTSQWPMPRTTAAPTVPPQTNSQVTLLSDTLTPSPYFSVDGDRGYSKPRSVALECGYYQKIALTGSFHTFRAGLVPLAIPVDEPVVIRYEILLDDRKVFDEDIASESGGRDVTLPTNGASTMTLAVECEGGQSSSSLSWAGFVNAGLS